MNAIISNSFQSVIIPTYNRKEMLSEAIESVLNQRNVDLEVIVVDDCSSDGTEEFVKSLNDKRIRYIRNEKNSRPDYSRMIGLRNARGKYISFLDDDDYYTDYDFFAKAIRIFEEHELEEPHLSMVCANVNILDTLNDSQTQSNIGRPGRVKGVDFILNPNHEYRKPTSTFPTVYRAEALREAGLENKIIFDTMTYLEAALEGDAWFMSDVIGVYRVGHTSLHKGGYKKSVAREEVHYRVVKENARRSRLIKESLYDRTDKKTADSWYISRVLGLIEYNSIARPAMKDRLKVTLIMLRESGFMPALWVRLLLRKIKNVIRNGLRKITPLRRLYKKIKYGDSHHGEH